MLYQQELDGLNPKFIFQYDENNLKVVRNPFVLMDWIDSSIINYFGFELVEQVVKDLKLSFQDVNQVDSVTLQTYPHKSAMFQKIYHITMDSEFTKTDSKGNISRFLKVDYRKPNPRNLNNVVLECLCRVFPKLRELDKNVVIDETENFLYGIKCLRSSSVNLTNLPKEYHHYSVAELLTLEKLERETIENDLTIYCTSGSFSGYLKTNDITLHINFGDSVEDLSIEQSYIDTLKYTNDYRSNGDKSKDYNKGIENLKETHAYKKAFRNIQ